ncbi:virulence factor Mce family protein [Mycolicibacterium aurum]|uniref:Virulence factor Mce family protein n=1 Tax=Mycolicibacterium aurum TaxID=1791 RepID=A0A448IJC9_MYCAU|nr:MCE family protein [Mycolicibacterium aurum]VEG52605.1 virulence factor Mce family protein [Mycolicibacterium aurum]
MNRRPHTALIAITVVALSLLTGCGWKGLNSLPLPGTQGDGPGSFTIEAQLPNVNNLQPNSRVRVGDVNVGTVTKIERQDWHALLTIRLNGDVILPTNATATLGQTSLLGSQHIELAAPAADPSQSRLHQGSLIPLDRGGSYPTTEQTLAAVSLLLNGGGLGQVQDITTALSTAFDGRENDLRDLLSNLDVFIGRVNDQTGDIIAATDAVNRVAEQFAAQKPIVDKALQTLPAALAVLNNQRQHLLDAVDQLGKFSALAADSVNQTKGSLVRQLKALVPVLTSLADAGPALTRSLGLFTTFPFAKDNLGKVFRGDYANITAIIDLTLSRLDAGLFTGTRFEGNLTELEMQWGRTIGTMPSPYTAGNPLVAPYRFDQGP